MVRVKFDRICKDILRDLATSLGFEPIAPFDTEPQKRIEQLLGFVRERDKRKSSVDIVWNHKLSPFGTRVLVKEVFADIVVAWEVDNSSNPQKLIRSSIDNLARINPRLGVELLLVGTDLKSIESYDRKFENAVDYASSIKTSRIIVINDVQFAILFNYITGRHPETLYSEYINICKKKPEIADALKERLKNLLETSIFKSDFKKEFYEKFLNRLTDN